MPAILKPALNFVPHPLQKAMLLPALHNVLHGTIEDGDLDFLQNKWLGIKITDLNLLWWFSFDNKKLIMASSSDIESGAVTEDVRFSANSDDLLLIAGRRQDPDTLFFQRKLKIEGDTELGLELKNVIDSLDIEQLPSVVHTLVDKLSAFLIHTQSELHTPKDR